MKIVYHEDYKKVYTSDPAASPGRIESIYDELSRSGLFEFITPDPCSEEDLRLAHTDNHIKSVQKNQLIYEVALLAVGGAIKASELALEKEPSFGLIRPPGHHASPNSCWGFCYFNNTAISIEKLRKEGKIKRALIIDIDLHYGDGTANVFSNIPEVSYYHGGGRTSEAYLNNLSEFLDSKRDFDIIAVSAGFDQGKDDWGGLLGIKDYKNIGSVIKNSAERVCEGRRYAVLEGGYNHKVLGKNVKSFLEGMR